MQQIQLPLKVLRNLILMSDLEKSDRIGTELLLPHLLFDLIHKCVDDSDFIKVIAFYDLTTSNRSF